MSLREMLRRPVARVAVPLFLVGGILTSVVEAYRGYEALAAEAAEPRLGAVIAERQPDPLPPVPAAPARTGAARTALETSAAATPSRLAGTAATLPPVPAVPVLPAGLAAPARSVPPWAPPAVPERYQRARGPVAPPAWSPGAAPAWSPIEQSQPPWASRRSPSSKSCGMGFG